MDRNHLFFALAMTCIANGVFSPFLIVVMSLWPAWYPSAILPVSTEVLFYLSSLIVSTATLLLSGIPAALFERMRGQQDSTPASVGIWLAGAAVLTLPALLRLPAAG